VKFSIKLSGGEELDRKLKNLETKVSRKIVRKAVRAAQKEPLVVAKSNAKTMIGGAMGGLISKWIKILSPKKQYRGSYRLDVGVSSMANDTFVVNSKSNKRNYIPAAIEYGHGSNKNEAAIPYMRNAHEKTKTRSLRTFKSVLKKGIEETARS